MSLEGQTLGEFEILARIGQGGMGAVYKARQTSLDRLVALKTLESSLAGDAEFIARFRREAKAAAALNHPNLVQVHAAGETDGLHWFAMEFVEGESAQARVKRKGRLDAAEAVAIGIHVATALDYAWRKAQLIHRDIKPDNIFLSGDGEVKLGDLGLAKRQNEDQSLTTTGASMGTPHYISPEQGQGEKDVDPRADIYSLGCTLFHFISGETPFKGDTALAVMMKHVSAPAPELGAAWPECPAELSRVVMKMMAKDPTARQQNYGEVIADLRGAYNAFTSGSLLSMIAVTQQQRPAAGKRLAATVLAVGLALIVAAAALMHFAPWKKGGADSSAALSAVPAKVDPTQPAAYVGTWSGRVGRRVFTVKEDHTAFKTDGDGQKMNGTWNVVDGEFHVKWEEGAAFSGNLSKDGQRIGGDGNAQWIRKKP